MTRFIALIKNKIICDIKIYKYKMLCVEKNTQGHRGQFSFNEKKGKLVKLSGNINNRKYREREIRVFTRSTIPREFA